MRRRLMQSLCGLLGGGVVLTTCAAMAAAEAPIRDHSMSAGRLNPAIGIPPSAFDWSGWYAGLQGGYGWGKTDAHAHWGHVGGAYEGFDYGNSGASGGFHLGYTLETGNAVYGLEADVEASGVGGSGRGIGAYHHTDIDWSTSLRGRLGIKAGARSLLYLTAGVSYAKVSVAQYTFTGITAFTEHNQWKAGWTAGAGIEHALTNKISARLEYRYLDLGKISYGDDVLRMRTTHEVTNHAVRAAISMRF